MAHPSFQDLSFQQLARRAAARSSYGSNTIATIIRMGKAASADTKAWRIRKPEAIEPDDTVRPLRWYESADYWDAERH